MRRKGTEGASGATGHSLSATHVVETLLDLLEASGVTVPADVDEALVLTQYAVQTRYPGDWESVTPEEARFALEVANRVLAWVERQIEA